MTGAQRLAVTHGKARKDSADAARRIPMVGDARGRREKDDFYATPAWVTELLIKAERESGHPLPFKIWEPACGDGAIVKVLRAHGCDVAATDLVDRGFPGATVGFDFLWGSSHGLDAAVVTNPPFKLAEQFVQQWCTRLPASPRLCLLLKLSFLQGASRTPWLFSETPLARVHVIAKRITFDGKRADGTPYDSNFMDAFAWFVWDRSHRGAPILTGAWA